MMLDGEALWLSRHLNAQPNNEPPHLTLHHRILTVNWLIPQIVDNAQSDFQNIESDSNEVLLCFVQKYNSQEAGQRFAAYVQKGENYFRKEPPYH